MRPTVFAIVLAGGEGKRLMPLTLDRAKPAVPFGGHYRLIDFCLSNLVNAGFYRIAVLTQYKSHSLDRHLATTWRLSPLLGNYVTTVPAQMRRGPRWFAGSADAIFQNLNLINDEHPDHICVFGADHVYRMDPRQMVEEHIASGAGLTVAGIRVPVADAGKFGVIEMTADGRRMARFVEKPVMPSGMGTGDEVYASMGNYVFSADALIEAVTIDAADESSKHDLGGNIIPALVEQGVANVYDFSRNVVPGQSGGRPYWRDVGSLDAYHEANMDLVSEAPAFNLSDLGWPILTWNEPFPPAKFLTSEEVEGRAVDSLICSGVQIRGGLVRRSVGPGVHVGPRAVVEESVILNGVEVGRDVVIRRAIIDKNVRIPDGSRIGVDAELDRARFTVSDGGVTVIGKGQKVE